jgi:pimeloyl-ACP methyl ester carboxylesterase
MRRPVLLCLALGLLWLTGPSARADTIRLKDGFVLRGKVVPQEQRTIVDPYGGQDLQVKIGYMVDDGPRRIIFSPAFVEDVDDKDFNKTFVHDWGYFRLSAEGARPTPSIREIVNITPWDPDGKRTFEYLSPAGAKITVYQKIGLVSPHYVRVDARPPPLVGQGKYIISSYYLTRELGPDQVRDLLAIHPTLKELPGLPPADRAKRRFQMIEFLVAAGWLDTAEYELDRLLKDFSNEKATVETARANLKKLQLLELAGNVEKAAAAGRHQWVQKQLADFPADAPEAALAVIRPLRERYEKTTEQLKQARRFLHELPLAIGAPGTGRLFTDAANAILGELNHDNVGRLESFVQQAAQAERLRAQKKKADLTPEEIMARAITGWLLGDASAESDVDTARRLWQARQFVLKYVSTTDPDERAKLLASYEKLKSDMLSMDVLAQVIGTLPPFEPEEKIETKAVERSIGGDEKNGRKYHLQLPPEYYHARAYPLLIVVPPGSDQVKATLERWGSAAAENGYILAVPEWGKGAGAAVYGYSSTEHAVVLDLLADVRRHFQVDSDRVFLAGLGSGADMAADVGLAHPDLFAGVLPTAGAPGPFIHRYFENAMYLPFYVVTGDRSGESYKQNYNLFKERWLMGVFPAYCVQYKGRGMETFDGEVPASFDWMKNKRRSHALGGFGRSGPGNGFTTMRTADNRFYWLSTDAISSRCLNEGAWNRNVTGAKIQALNMRKDNQINVTTVGLGQLSIWLVRGTNAKGEAENLINFDKGLTVWINSARRLSNAMVRPNLGVLLEDLYERGDRQRLVLGRLDFKLDR